MCTRPEFLDEALQFFRVSGGDEDLMADGNPMARERAADPACAR